MLDAFSVLREPVTIYLLRHGQTEANLQLRMQGRLDFPLTDAGRAQAAAAAGFFVDKSIGVVATSPLSRAAETASIVAGKLGLEPPRTLDSLTELDTGKYTGLTHAEIESRYPDEYPRFRSESWGAVEGAEPVDVLYRRAAAAWRELAGLAAGGKGDVLAVTHSGFIHWLIKSTVGCRTWMPLFPIGNCGICSLYVEPLPGGRSPYSAWRLINHHHGT